MQHLGHLVGWTLVLAVVQPGGAETALHILPTLGPGPDACKVEHVHIVICMMADP